MSSAARLQHYDDMSFDDLTKSLTDNFSILADEVQLLSDRKTILEHKLRFAHEQYQQLADKYAPGHPEISATLAALQIPPDLHVQTPERATFVPLPSRRPTGSKQQTAEAIRDGRKASQLIVSLRGWVPTSESGGRSTTGTANSTMRTSKQGTSTTTILEQDFTVPGKMSKLECPFAPQADASKPSRDDGLAAPTSDNGRSLASDLSPHCLADPICAAMYSDTHSSAPASASGSAKCPIRFLDQHSPEAVAQYFETHKHEIPRSHEVCVKRYQRNEEDIRKLDAKYGNIVSMIQGLGAKHQPMLPADEHGEADDQVVDRTSNERVQNWAKAVSSDGVEDPSDVQEKAEDEEDRKSRFGRPLRDVRVGESPSRPWGIQIPYVETPVAETGEFAGTASPPPAPVFVQPTSQHHRDTGSPPSSRPVGRCPFGHGAAKAESPAPLLGNPKLEPPETTADGEREEPNFFIPEEDSRKDYSGPKMVFTGPVFIGYPIDQAVALMQQWQKGTHGN